MHISFTFIIPFYNLPIHYLERMLSSIPSREDVQIIVVDDCSSPKIVNTEELENVTQKYKAELIFSQKNQGPGIARNTGLLKAKGNWVLFADADDVYNTESLDKLLSLCCNTASDVVWFGINGNLFGFRESQEKIQYCTQEEKWRFLQFVGPVNKVIRKKLLLDNSIYFDNTFYGEDQIFSIKLVCLSKCPAVFSTNIYNYISNPASLSKTEDIHRLIDGFNTEMKFNSILKKYGELTLEHRNKLVGGLLYRIYLRSKIKYYFCILKEYAKFGYRITVEDYRDSCILRFVRPNIFCQIIDPIRIKIGYLIKFIIHKNGSSH